MKFHARDVKDLPGGVHVAACGCRWRDLENGLAHFSVLCAHHAATFAVEGYDVTARLEISGSRDD